MSSSKNQARTKTSKRKAARMEALAAVSVPDYGLDTKWYFMDYPKDKTQALSVQLVCNESGDIQQKTFLINERIANICSRILRRKDRSEEQGQRFIDLRDTDLPAIGIRDFVHWAEFHEVPNLIAQAGSGDILSHAIKTYYTAKKLKAGLLADLVLAEICRIGRQSHLAVYEEQVDYVFNEFDEGDCFRLFLARYVAYLQRKGKPNPYIGDEDRVVEQTQAYHKAHPDFRLLLLKEIAKETANKNPCFTPLDFTLTVINYMEMREAKANDAATTSNKRQKRRAVPSGSRDTSPLFVQSDSD